MDDLPAYGERINELVDSASTRMEHFQESVYRTLVPRRFQEGAKSLRRPPPSDGRSRAQKKKPDASPRCRRAIQEVRVRPEPTPLFNYIYDYLRSFYSVLLMASFVPFLVYFILSWRDHMRGAVAGDGGGRSALHRGQGHGRRGGNGARLRDREFFAGPAAQRGQRAAVRLGEAAVLDRGGADERIPEPGSVHRTAAGADSAAGRGAAAEAQPAACTCS